MILQNYGIYQGLNFADYLEIPAVNASLLTHANHSWKQFRWVQQNGFAPKTDTRIGTALHSFVELLPSYDMPFVVVPDFKNHPDNVTGNGTQSTSRTAWVKEQEAAFAAENDKEIITQQVYDRAERMLQSVEENKQAMRLIEGSTKELTLVGGLSGVDCKGRVDGVNGRVLWDLKSSRDIQSHRFGRTAADLRYVFKMAFYWRLLSFHETEIDQVFLIAVQDSVPRADGKYNDAPDCAVYEIPMVAIENQLGKIDQLLTEYKRCLDLDEWPGVPNGELVIPNWAMEDQDLVD